LRPRPRRLWLHVGLFLATCVSTTVSGAMMSEAVADAETMSALLRRLFVDGAWLVGLPFSATLMSILLAHEMGHFVLARRHRVDASLPYFIPFPLGIGTLGAVISMRSPIASRNSLVDVGAAGPLAGLILALPLLVYGLSISEVKPFLPGSGGLIEGNSLLYIGLKYLLKGAYLPGGGHDVFLHPVGLAAWMGLLVTMINLFPIGQLDGGHVAFAYFGDRYQRGSVLLHRGLLAVGVGIVLVLGGEAWTNGHGGEALAYGLSCATPWFVWALLLAGMRRVTKGRYHPPVGPDSLTAGRRALCWLMLLLFVLLFTPVPFRTAL
jgi:membrane-associated protease RseP (regulator of RpoE activity)